MKFKLNILILSLLAFALVFTSCGDAEDHMFDEGEFIYFNREVTQTVKTSTDPISVDVIFSSPQGKSASATAEIEVTLENAEEGVDFEFATPLETLTFDTSNAFRNTIIINPLGGGAIDPDDAIITLTISSVSNGSIGLPGPDRNNATHTIVMASIDCDYLISGTYDVVTTMTDPAGCEGVTNVVQVTILGEGLFEITDITGGMYANCYGSADNPAQINGQCDGPGLSVVSQPDVVYGDDEFNGSGQINPNGTFQIEWSNGFGDSGLSIYTPR